MVQQQYWIELFQLKTHIGFIERLLEGSETIDRTLKIVLAVAASSSIGAWVIWRELSWLWASIIALSQVIAAVNPFLPYRDRIKSYSSLLHELEEVMIQAEFKWHAIADGELTSAEINRARFEVRSQKQKALKRHIQTTIPFKRATHEAAEASAREYLQSFYPARE
jgi:hypothetical protein